MNTLEEIRTQYLDRFCVANEFTEATKTQKRFGTARFLRFTNDRPITSELIFDYIASIKGRGCRQNYVNREIFGIVKPFLDYAKRHGAEVDIDWEEDFPRKLRRRPEIVRRSYEPVEVNQLFSVCETEEELLMLELCYECGFREMELTRIYRENFRGNQVLVLRKGDKWQWVDIPKCIMKMVAHQFDRTKSRYLFPSHKNKGAPITPDGLYERSKSIGWRAGFPEFSLHKLRYSFATEMYHSGADMRSIQQKLNHSSMRTTELYVQFQNEQIQSDYDRCFAEFDENAFETFGKKLINAPQNA